ncbi:MAG TPA: phosphoribosylglycinamide formyltransferase [Smithella sp.]|nr:phosphoribosylglycinamide formyltransferase [Smithella sp.]MDM7987727.1 phosphoribosylglycinamide formyltransferase [Smithella sp.]HNY49075.1 phosphoribosylglycinamide formyltransferase [Smithella sp.]HOG90405.1 phosphoribosylglycinamide formyltransferase [Smithella sp.]HOU50474.1 phosphoribosylglycinamide formyltransferase [Smithella sp.]
MADLLKLGVLISGNGSNLQSIIDNIENGSLKAVIKIVVSNNPDAYGLTRAKKHGIPCAVLQNGDFKSKDDFDSALVKILKDHEVELVILAGFMRIISPTLLKAFPGSIMNIHPALLPSFPGLHGQKQAVDYGVKFSGCTVHFVDEGVDTGPIIIQAAVPVMDDDTEETLAARILKEEHKIYPQAIQLFADNRLEINGRKVIIKNR